MNAQRSDWTEEELARLRLEGLEHIDRLRSGTATDRDAAAFVTWRGQSRAHEEALRSALRLRTLVREVAAPAAGARPGGTVVEFDRGATLRQPSRRVVLGGAIAASIAGGLLFVGHEADLLPDLGEAAGDYRTGPGERRRVALGAGASAELNTRSAIALQRGSSRPTVELLRGEVAMTAGSRGVAVVAGAGHSVGERGGFNVRRDGETVCVTCLSGMLAVTWRTVTRHLHAAEQIRYDADAIGAVAAGIDAHLVEAWRTGTLIFHAEPLERVVAEINRYRVGHIYVANRALAARSVSGTFYTDRLEEFLDQTRMGLGASVTRLPGGIVVLH